MLTGVGVLDTFYFWARLVDENGNSGAFTEAVMGKSDPDPAPIVANIHGAITETELSKSLINQFNQNDEAAKKRGDCGGGYQNARRSPSAARS